MIGGIVFFRTENLTEVSEFYTDRIGCSLWLDQGGCRILKFHNMLFGLCQRDTTDREGMITFVYASREDVDRMHQELSDRAQGPVKDNENYRIYHFFAEDPDGRAIEFQFFWDSHMGEV
jgi:predicted lactoylglutathione lyase